TNSFNGQVEYVTTENIKAGSTFSNPATNNPGQSKVLDDPVNQTPAAYYQGASNTSTYFYFPSGTSNLNNFSPTNFPQYFIADPASPGNYYMKPGVYYVDGSITLKGNMSPTTASQVTVVATGKVQVVTSPGLDFPQYQNGLLSFGSI